MNAIKIEKGAVEALRKIIRLHDKMDELLQENDKGPSWDGEIYIYKSDDLKAEHIQYKVPVQVKGRNNKKLLDKQYITYPVQYKHLRNYFNNGGVCYFVVVISDDGVRASIFYNALTPIKLQALLKNTETKKPDQTKNITLMRLKNNDKNGLYKILLQFGHDSKEQGTGELVRRAISVKDIEKIDSIRMTSFAFERNEVIKNIKTGEVCLFGHVPDADIWLPLTYELQRKMDFVEKIKIDEPFGVDGAVYYSAFELRKNMEQAVVIQLSKNLCIDIRKKKTYFKPLTDIEGVIKDIRFLEAVRRGRSFCIGRDKICDFGHADFDDELQGAVRNFTQLQSAVKTFEIKLGKNFGDFTDDDWKAIDELLNIYQGKFRPKKETAWHIWWWQGKIVPFFMAMNPDNGEVLTENGMHLNHFKITTTKNNYQIPALVMFKRDIWENLYDVDEDVLLDELEKGELNTETEGDYSLLFIEILAAYDTTKNEKYYNVASVISDKLRAVSPEYSYWRVNELQLLKRKRNLSESELQELEDMEDDTDDKKLRCGINILLDNKRKAKKELDEMSQEERDEFMRYPIYNLL